jgi:hypothetical protein
MYRSIFFRSLTPILFALSLSSPFSSPKKKKDPTKLNHIPDFLQEKKKKTPFGETSEQAYKSICLSSTMTPRVKDRNEVISQPSA